MKLHFRSIYTILGWLWLLNGGFMLLCLPVSVYYDENEWQPILLSALITMLSGSAAIYLTRNRGQEQLGKRDGYLIVSMGWLSMSIFGSLPYVFSSEIPDLADAFFETMSGYTTTGASILTDVESLSHGLLFWRSLTQWIGGMGIIVLTVAILPILGIGGMQLFLAESPGLTPDKIKPRINDTAKRLWMVYLILTFAQAVLLKLGGMPYFDSINHALTTMATGGFSTKNASIAFYNSAYIEYVIIMFMFLAGTNFTLSYFALHGNFKRVLQNEEFRFYASLVLLVALIMTVVVHIDSRGSLELAFRQSLFQLVSIVTTTGYVTYDYTQWVPFAGILLFMAMFVGASAGSTAGGVKVVRHIILLRNSALELRRQIHPSAILPVRLNKRAVSAEITYNVMAFMIIYLMVFAIGAVVMALMGHDFLTSVGASATCLGNIGPGFGTVGPVNNFAHVSTFGKWFLSLLMMLGRLELFTVLILLTPYFWKN
jgi:trk system potassium uptake protein